MHWPWWWWIGCCDQADTLQQAVTSAARYLQCPVPQRHRHPSQRPPWTPRWPPPRASAGPAQWPPPRCLHVPHRTARGDQGTNRGTNKGRPGAPDPRKSMRGAWHEPSPSKATSKQQAAATHRRREDLFGGPLRPGGGVRRLLLEQPLGLAAGADIVQRTRWAPRDPWCVTARGKPGWNGGGAGGELQHLHVRFPHRCGVLPAGSKLKQWEFHGQGASW
jgi:hypothetical protein